MAGLIKICGLTNAQDAIEAASLGATHLGFVFFRNSPRHIEPADAELIVAEIKRAAFDRGLALPAFVGLFVDAGEKQLGEAAPFLSHFQFHGREPPERCVAMREAFGLDIIKAAPIASLEDAAAAQAYAGAADMLLFDARPPKGAERPGGHGAAFDWSLLDFYRGATPFLLAGGLRPETVAAAIASQSTHSGFAGVDVASGVESAPGRKSATMLKTFIDAARATTHYLSLR